MALYADMFITRVRTAFFGPKRHHSPKAKTRPATFTMTQRPRTRFSPIKNTLYADSPDGPVGRQLHDARTDRLLGSPLYIRCTFGGVHQLLLCSSGFRAHILPCTLAIERECVCVCLCVCVCVRVCVREREYLCAPLYIPTLRGVHQLLLWGSGFRVCILPCTFAIEREGVCVCVCVCVCV